MLPVTLAISRLDEWATVGPNDTVRIDGVEWSEGDLRASVAWELAEVSRHVVSLYKVSKRDVALMLAAHGASPFTVGRHARAIAARMRANVALHTWSGTV